MLLATKEPLFAEIFAEGVDKKSKEKEKEKEKERGVVFSSTKATLGSTFKASLASLMETLRSTAPNYIRCIKPNEQKAAFLFDPVHVLSQLRACGVLETIRISAAGYPSRTNFVQFADRYSLLAPKTAKLIEDERVYCKAILDEIIKDEDKYQVGKTKIFLRAGQLAFLERKRANKLNQAATMIQKHIRRLIAVKKYKKLKAGIAFAQKRKQTILIPGFS